MKFPKSWPYEQRLLMSLAVLAIVLLILIRWLVLPLVFDRDFPPVADVLDTSIAEILRVLVAFVVVATVVRWLIPPPESLSPIVVLHPSDLRRQLDVNLERCTEFVYLGHTGRWTRSVTLPKLAKQAVSENSTKHIKILVLDPRNEFLCRCYSDYRQGLRSGHEGGFHWSAELVRNELLATIVSALCWRCQEPLLKIDIYLLQFASVFRIDLTTNGAIITLEDPEHPALFCKAGSSYYNAFREDVELATSQGFLLQHSNERITIESCSPADVGTLLAACGLNMSLDPKTLSVIARIAKFAENPYP